MKKGLRIIISIVAIFVLAVMLVSCEFFETNGTDKEEEAPSTHASPIHSEAEELKILVAYFSWSGNLQKMAGWIKDECGADLFRIEPEDAYSSVYDDTSDRARRERNEGIRPTLANSLSNSDMEKYDVILLGFPVWHLDLPMCVESFLTSYDLSGKTIIPFFSHEGSSDGARSLSTLSSLCSGSTVKTSSSYYLSIHGDDVDSSETTVRNWVKALGLSKNRNE